MYSGDFHWPNDAHIAVVFNIAWEAFPEDLASATSSHQTSKAPADAAYLRAMRPIYEHAFAETGGFQRIMDLWERYEIQGSCYVNGLTVQRYSELAKEAVERGHELLAEGWDHEFLYSMTAEEEEAALDRTIEVFKEVIGKAPSGFSSPGGHPTENTIPLVASRGLKYMCGMRNSDLPFIIKASNGKRIVGMTSYALSDSRTMPGQWTPRGMAEVLRDGFDGLYDEGLRGFPKMLTYGMHPRMAHAFRTRPLEEVIRHIKGTPKVWVATREQIADWVLANYPEMDLISLYPNSAAASDAHYGLGIGEGGSEALRKNALFRAR
jgi:peptidoglycan/xylan/chitin deacetylase (PgdA/CDA1 family)